MKNTASEMLTVSKVPQIVRLAPPRLQSSTVLQKITCTRPMREECFNISVEKNQAGHFSKTIVNCYGMGGSGWMTVFGSVAKAIRLFQETGVAKSIPIRIVGSGCMGLTAAIELTRMGYKVAGITTRELYDIPSWRAGGYLALVSVKTSPEEQENLNGLGIETFRVCQHIDQGEHPYISRDAVRYMPVYCSKDTEAGVEELEAQGLIPLREEVTLDFGAVQHTGFLRYMTYFIDPTKVMKQLTAEVQKLAIPLTLHAVHAWEELEEEVVFNCSGLGGRELNRDSFMIPVRGHLVLLNQESGAGHMDYMIYTTVQQEGREEYIYMFPKCAAVSSDAQEGIACQGILGGSFIAHAEKLSQQELAQLDQEEFQKLLDRNSLFFHGKKFS